MKIVREESSFGSDAIAEESVLNSPEAVAEGLTTTEPDGGDVLETAWASGKTSTDKRVVSRNIVGDCAVQCGSLDTTPRVAI